MKLMQIGLEFLCVVTIFLLVAKHSLDTAAVVMVVTFILWWITGNHAYNEAAELWRSHTK